MGAGRKNKWQERRPSKEEEIPAPHVAEMSSMNLPQFCDKDETRGAATTIALHNESNEVVDDTETSIRQN